MATFAIRSVTTGTSNVNCVPCKYAGNIAPAAKFCQDCSGHLCSTCVALHQKGEQTKSHSLTSLPVNKPTPVISNMNSTSTNSFCSIKSATSPLLTASTNFNSSFKNPARKTISEIYNSQAPSEPGLLRSSTNSYSLSQPGTSNARLVSAGNYTGTSNIRSTAAGNNISPNTGTSDTRSASAGNYTSSNTGTSNLRLTSAGNYNYSKPGASRLHSASTGRLQSSPEAGTSYIRASSASTYNSLSPSTGNKRHSNPDEVFTFEEPVSYQRDKTDGLSSSHHNNDLSPNIAIANIVRDKQAAQKLETSVRHIQSRFEHAQKDGEESLRKLKQTSEVFDGNVTKFRKTVLDLLDRLETALLKKKERLYDAKTTEVQERMKTCDSAVTTLTCQLDKLHSAYTTDDDAESILTTRMTQEVVRRYDKICTDMEKSPKNLGFHLIPDANIEQFFKYKTDLGTIKDDSAPVNVTTVTSPTWKSQDKTPSMTSLDQLESRIQQRGNESTSAARTEPTSPLRSYSSEEVNIRLPTDVKACSITGSVFLPGDTLIVADATNKTVKHLSTDFEIISSIEMTSAPRDIASISATEVAVTLPNDKSVQILRVGKELTVMKIIKLDIEGYGISCFKDELFVTSGWSAEKVISVITVEGSLKRKLKLDKDVLKCPLYVTIDPKNLHIYVSDYEHGIVCMDMTGSVIFRHNDSSTKGYMGITSSQAGDVYVSTLQPNGISRVHKDKRRGSRSDENHLETMIYLPNKGGQSPRAVSFSRRSRKMAVSFVGMNMDSLSVYSI